MNGELVVSNPDLILVEESYYEDVAATKAWLKLTVKGSSYFAGNAAFKKAKELAVIVDSLKAAGIGEEDFKLVNVGAEMATGIFTKFSSVTYRIHVKCNDLDKLPDALTAIASSKNAILDGIMWVYPENLEAKERWLTLAIEKAKQRASVLAASLNVEIRGVHECVSQYWDEQADNSYPRNYGRNKMMMSSNVMERARTDFIDPGFRLTGLERRGVSVAVQFLIAAQ